jgi:hypothetical protein
MRLSFLALDDRILPTFSAFATPSALVFTANDAPSQLAVRTSGNVVQWATDGGSFQAIPNVSAAAIRSVSVTGSAYVDRIDLSGLVNVPVGAAIRAGGGSDYVIGSPRADVIDGGPGRDSARLDSRDTPQNLEVWNPYTPSADNQQQKVKVLVLSFDPVLPNRGGKTVNQAYGYKNPAAFASAYAEAVERTSGAAVHFEVEGIRTLNQFPPLADGTRYTPTLYSAVVEGRATPWPAMMDYTRVLREQGVPAMIDAGQVDEVWLFGGPYMGFWEAAMAGPGNFYINGGTYPNVASQRPFAIMGFNTERFDGVLLHGNGHRIEATMTRAYGGWNVPSPHDAWDLFGANAAQSAGRAGAGTVHFPPNATADYDYSNTRVVNSYADQFLNYPGPVNTSTTTPVSRATWQRFAPANHDDQDGYLAWWYMHIPRAAGTNADGRPNNWYRLVYDFNHYTPDGRPLPLRAFLLTSPSPSGAFTFRVAYEGAAHVDVGSLDGGDVRATGSDGRAYAVQLVSRSDPTNGNYRAATYRIIGAPKGMYRIETAAGQVRNLAGQTLGATVLGTVRI